MRKWVCNGTEFKVGNIVRVMRQVDDLDPDGMGTEVQWENTWIDDMDKQLGLTFEIANISDEGIEFEGASDISYLFPLAALDYVAAAKQVKDAA